MNATVLDENGKAAIMSMGCYGMGISRLVGAIIEQNHDDNGIAWPINIAPFHVVIIAINPHKSEQAGTVAETLHDRLAARGVEVMLDDREGHRPGVKFADAELLGIPYRVVVGDRGLSKGVIELTERSSGQTQEVSVEAAIDLIVESVLGA